MYNKSENNIFREDNAKEIIVLGTGSEIVKSNMAILTYDIVNQHPDPLKTIMENRKLVQAATNYTKMFGIKDSDMFFSTKSLVPVYDENNNITDYKAITSVKILFYDMDSISEYLYNIKGRHVTVNDVSFTVANPEEFYNLALEKAVQNLYNKALLVAEEIKVIIEEVPEEIVEITDVENLIENALPEDFFTINAIVRGRFRIITNK